MALYLQKPVHPAIALLVVGVIFFALSWIGWMIGLAIAKASF